MTDVNTAPAGDGDNTPMTVVEAPRGSETSMSIRDAGRILASARAKKPAQAGLQQQPEPTPDTGDEANSPPSDQESDLSLEDNAAPAEEPTSDATEEGASPSEADAQEPISPPRSWTAEDKETFKTLPRETQARLVDLDRAREKEVRRVQNETAEQRKAYEERVAAADQMRQQYEQALPILLQNLQQAQAGEFSDIKTMADVEAMAKNDWPRYIQWDAAQKRIAATHQELITAQQRQQIEQQQAWQAFVAKEDSLFAEKHPEVADPVRGQKLKESAISTLRDAGFSDNELSELWSGQKKMDVRDHRWQSIMLKAARFDIGQTAKQQVTKKAPPPVQRPGVAQPAQAGLQQELSNLDKRFQKTGSARDAAQLIAARRAAASRR